MLPGIPSKMLKKLKKQDLEVVKEHIKLYKAAAQRKKDLLDGKLEEIGEFLKHPRKEADQLAKVIKDVEKIAGHDLLETLVELEFFTRELIKSINEEFKLIKSVENIKSTKDKAIQKEIEGEIILGTILEHQISLMLEMRNLSLKSINQANELKDAKKRSEVGRNSMNLNNIANFLANLIIDEQVPNLSVAYNAMHVEEWDKIEERIIEAKAKFPEIGEHLL